MDYENRLNTLKNLHNTLTNQLKSNEANVTPERKKESEFHLKMIESEINRISKMRSYKKN